MDARLSIKRLEELSRRIPTPKYLGAQLEPSVVHIGLGNFHRSHFASYLHELAQDGNRAWGIVGSGVREEDSTLAGSLQEQDWLYTLTTRSHGRTETQIIAAITDYVHATRSIEPLARQIADPTTQVVSLTVTESGYPINRSGIFDPDSPNARGNSAFSALATGLELRRRNASGPLTVLSFDNLVHNGRMASIATHGVAEQTDPSLTTWIADNVTFPSSMVDRITPRPSDSHKAWLERHHQILDTCPVVAEPFRQWVVEDAFAGKRLPLDDMDVISTSNVEPYEDLKLRCLNGSHSALAYLAKLAGHDVVSDALSDPLFHDYISAFLDHEASAAVGPVPGIRLMEYNSSIVDRFSNTDISDQIDRLAQDGTAKMRSFIMPTVVSQVENGRSLSFASLAIAGWCQYLLGFDDYGKEISLSHDADLPIAIDFARKSLRDPSDFLLLDSVFLPQVRSNHRFVEQFTDNLESLRARGVRPTIRRLLARQR